MTRSAASLFVAVIFVVGCVHDLTEVAERTNEPAFLGALSGLYVLSIAIDDPVLSAGFEINFPIAGRVMIIHLENPEKGPDPVFAIVETEVPFQAENILQFLHGTYDGVSLVGVNQDGDPISAHPIAGGGGLVLNSEAPICLAGSTFPLRAERVCTFNASLSGVYRGAARDCAGREQRENFLALAFLGDGLVGMHYPDTQHFMFGAYDRFRQVAVGADIDFQTISAINPKPTSGFEMFVREADGEVSFDLESFEFVGATRGTCEERFSGTRLSGGDPETCAPFAADRVGLNVGLFTANESSDLRVLYISVTAVEDPETVLDVNTKGLVISVRRQPGDIELTHDNSTFSPTDGITARYVIDRSAGTNADTIQYQVMVAKGGDPRLNEFSFAMPRCVYDDGSQRLHP